MALLAVANLHLAFGTRPVLAGVNLTLDAGEHVGLVGRNGCGKSTLMKLIAGLEKHKPDEGQVQLARGARVGYLTQDPDLDLGVTLREEAGRSFAHLYELHKQLDQVTHDMAEADGDELEKLLKTYERLEHEMHAAGGYAVEHKIEATLHGVGLPDELFNVKVGDLSGGQKGRLSLAKLLLSEPDVLLLDEPTNHLDISGREWLEEYLRDYRGAVLVVSHDRWLLDRVVSKIYELEAGQMVEYPGNYHKYRELRAERYVAQSRQYEKQQTKIKQEKAFIDRYRAGQRSKQAQGREKRLERYVENEKLDKPMDQGAMNIRLRPIERAGDNVIAAEHVTKGYEGKPLFSDFTLTVKRGNRIGVIGPNGAGKSTLINCLLGQMEPDEGVIKSGAAVSIGHFKQTHEDLNLDQTVVDYLQLRVAGELEQSARDLAGAFLFSGQDQEKPMRVMSGGERARAVLAGLVAGGHNLLVLDEPTNHLDIPSAERLEEMIKVFTAPPTGWGNQATGGGTLLLITHDRMLLDDLVDQLIVLDGAGNIEHFLGNYSDLLRTQRQRAQQADAQAAQQAAAQAKKDKAKRDNAQRSKANKNSKQKAGQQKSRKGSNSPFGNWKQDRLESRIEELEAGVTDIDMRMMTPEVYNDGELVKSLREERDSLKEELGKLEAEWARRADA